MKKQNDQVVVDNGDWWWLGRESVAEWIDASQQ